MKLLVTGGAGCLGSAIVNYFQNVAEEILVIDNFATGDPSWIRSAENVSVAKGDVRDKDFIEEAFLAFSPSHVIHAAASYANPDDWVGDAQVNGLGTLNVVRAAEKTQVSQLIYLQTALCYGIPEESPIPIGHPLSPFTSYAISKVTGENYILASTVKTAISLRLANICAPRLAIGPIPTFYKRINDGVGCFVTEAERDFLDVDDFLSLLSRIFDGSSSTRGAFNVSTGSGTTIRELFRKISSLAGAAVAAELVPMGADDVKSVVLDPSVTVQTFDWTPKRSLGDTLRRQLNWFDSFGVGEIRTHLKFREE